MSNTPYLDAWIEKMAGDLLVPEAKGKIGGGPKLAPPKAVKSIPKKPAARKPLFDFDKGNVFGSGKE